MKQILLAVLFGSFALVSSAPAQGPGQGPGQQRPAPRPTDGANKPTMAADESEQKILAVLADINANQSKGMMNVPPEDGRLLRMLAETTGAKNVVEIGTSNGYSGIWFSLALRKTGGKLTTFDIDEGRFKLAVENFKRAGVSDLIKQVLGDAHEKVAEVEGPIDILFLDADKAGYIDYLDKLLPKMRPGGLILAHNTTNLGADMQDYFKAVTTNPKLETLFLHTERQGMGVTMVKR